MKTQTTLIDISKIRLSEKNEKLNKRDHREIEKLRRLIEADIELPPIRLNPDFSVDDGRHRLLAYRAAGHTKLECIIL